METRNIIFSIVMVFFAFVLAVRLWDRYEDTLIVMSTVILVGMLALLFLSVDERLRRIEEEIKEKERSVRVSLQSVEEEVREKVGTATRKLEEISREVVKKGYR
jgi:hypothetical protein